MDEHRDERQRQEERYRIYTLPKGGGSNDLRCIATTKTPESLGQTLVWLREEDQITHVSRVGIKDDVEGKWIINPFGLGEEQQS